MWSVVCTEVAQLREWLTQRQATSEVKVEMNKEQKDRFGLMQELVQKEAHSTNKGATKTADAEPMHREEDVGTGLRSVGRPMPI